MLPGIKNCLQRYIFWGNEYEISGRVGTSFIPPWSRMTYTLGCRKIQQVHIVFGLLICQGNLYLARLKWAAKYNTILQNAASGLTQVLDLRRSSLLHVIKHFVLFI